MCLAIPSRIVEIKDTIATVDVDGVKREASIMLLEDVKKGDYVIVHAGFAISKLDEKSAEQTLTALREMLDLSDQSVMKTESAAENAEVPAHDALNGQGV